MHPSTVDRRPVLCGDIGGTSLRLAVAVPDGEGVDLRAPFKRPTAGLHALDEIVATYIDDLPPELRPSRACIAVAGPVADGRAALTNSVLDIDARRMPLRTRLANDLEAAAACLPLLGEHDSRHLGGADPDLDHPAVVLGVGTGLGQALVVPGPAGPIVVAGEAGHGDYAPQRPVEDQLLRWLRDRSAEGPSAGHVSWERVASGQGLGEVLAYASAARGLGGAATEALDGGAPAAQVVFEHAETDAACGLALDLFIHAVGAEAGNAALRVLARGGVWLVGGVARRLGAFAADGRLRAAFERKGRFSELVATLPLRLVTHPDPGLLGAAWLAMHTEAA